MQVELIDESMTNKLGKALAKSCPEAPFFATLRGDLGVGKSHLVRAFLKKLGVTDAIPSPTYTLCETYIINRKLIISHMDLYRLQDPEELEFLGFRDMLDRQGVLIEWPERAASFLPFSDLDLHLIWNGERRICVLAAKSEKGERWLSNLEVINAA
ncbi:MAG: tRNA (adenosine(37)-N6)-threonylcarbamoyltransferase complex ATPase subunit type 1 TsaE [Gammaproteobacteria bacterium]|nr:tRNA (adenosine(37)-N6)-threonylcarbamoyltransferase complex ATPase subunit type 1 TsaE [Gammaproteobacteria bacterium]HAN81354.1 tRNA (adenosine(37)-N6)-threonylcarbamoyltransferase complex ATPase subunit type 1 TsaE [Gammaproteobacteria bacterium]